MTTLAYRSPMQRPDTLSELGQLKETEICQLRRELGLSKVAVLDNERLCNEAQGRVVALERDVCSAKSACSTSLVGTQITAQTLLVHVARYHELRRELGEARAKATAARHQLEAAEQRERSICQRLSEVLGLKKGLESLAKKQKMAEEKRREYAVEESLAEQSLAQSRRY